MTRERLLLGLLSVAGVSALIAIMTFTVISELTDYATWDVAAVDALTTWSVVLLAVAGAAVVASIIVGRAARAARGVTPPR